MKRNVAKLLSIIGVLAVCYPLVLEGLGESASLYTLHIPAVVFGLSLLLITSWAKRIS